jgi:four helix bundle protein
LFDFCKLDVYQKAKGFCLMISKTLLCGKYERIVSDQLRRASLSIMLNIAESSSRFSSKDRKNFMVIARGSAFECAAILEYMFETAGITEEKFKSGTEDLEEISKMLYGLIRKLDK